MSSELYHFLFDSWVCIELAKKTVGFFPQDGLAVFNSIQTILLDRVGTAVISACI